MKYVLVMLIALTVAACSGKSAEDRMFGAIAEHIKNK